MKLSDKIYACRTRAKLSQEELAERVGVSRQAVSRWECGDNVPEPAKLLLLARTFGVTADWLLDDEQGMPEEAQKEDAKQPWVDTLVENCKSLAHRFDQMLDECIPADGAQEAPTQEEPPTAEPEPEPKPQEPAAEPQEKPRRTPAEYFRRLEARFGWKLGVYIALIGIVLTALSTLAQQLLTAVGVLMLCGGVILTVILLANAGEKRKK